MWLSRIGRWALVALVLLGCQHTAAREAPLEIVVPTEAATLDPRFSTRSLDIKVTRLLHAGLVGLHPETLEPVPLVARSWRWVDDRTLEVILKPGIRFHSGRRLAPADVCATLEAIRDPVLGSPHRPVVSAIGKCIAEGERRVVIVLAEPRATLLTDLEVPILRADQARAPPRPKGGLDGLGPYSLDELNPGSVLLGPKATGVRPEPRHSVVVRTVRDENARALRLLAGESDIAPNAISAALLPALSDEASLSVRSRRGANVTYLLLHNERPPFDRVEARRAVARALDRELIVKTLLAGRAEPARWIFPDGHWAAAPPGVHVPHFDPDAAREILSTLPEVTLLSSTDRARVTLARAMAQMLGDAGLSVRVVPLDLGVMLERLDAGDYQMAVLQMPELTEPNILRWFFHPRGVPGEGGPGKNRARYRDAVAGRLLDEAARVVDRGKRAVLYRQLATRMMRQLPVIPLWHEDQVAVVSDRAKAFVPSAEGRWLSVTAVP